MRKEIRILRNTRVTRNKWISMFGSGLEIKSRYLGSQFMGKGLFALREILFVLQKNLSTWNHFQCERFFSSTKILSSVTKLQRHRRVVLQAYNFLSSKKIYCSVTATLQRVIIIRNRYHTKWSCVRDPIYCHLEMDRRGEMSDRDSDPAPFVRNSYIPETQQYLNYYGSQCYYEEPQALPQYYYFLQSQPQGPQVEDAGASMWNINSRNKVPVA